MFVYLFVFLPFVGCMYGIFLVHFLQHCPGGVHCNDGGHCNTGHAFLTHDKRLPLHSHFTHGSSDKVTSRSSNTFWPFR